MGLEVLLYVPNRIDYIRLFLLGVSFFFYKDPWKFLVLYLSSALLDGIDGYLARKLGQTSAFGAWLDIVTDITGRGMLWCRLYTWGYFIAVLEWLTFVATHGKSDWKETEDKWPWFVKKVMDKGFKTPFGFYVVGSLYMLPVWLYSYHQDFLSTQFNLSEEVQMGMIFVFIVGRVMCMVVEIFYIKQHILFLCDKQKG